MWSYIFARPPTGRIDHSVFFDSSTLACLPLNPTTARGGHRSLTTQNGTTLQGQLCLNFVSAGRSSVSRPALHTLIRHGIVTRWLVALTNTRTHRQVAALGAVSTCGDIRREKIRFNSGPGRVNPLYCANPVLLSAVDFPSGPVRQIRDCETTVRRFGAAGTLVRT